MYQAPIATPPRRPRILLISLFHPELLRGGAQQICYELFEGLKERGDADVTLLASTDESNPALFKAGARITGFDGKPDESVGPPEIGRRAADHRAKPIRGRDLQAPHHRTPNLQPRARPRYR